MKLKLPPKVIYILDILERNGFEAYVVGGCVRDAVLAKEPADWDITTGALPEQVKKLFRRVVDTGIKHGTVTVMLEEDGFEVTTFRGEKGVFAGSLREDLDHRDFTINAMAFSERRGLIDCHGGMRDLQKKVIRCVGDPSERFNEDPLRVMRAVRFAAQLGFSVDRATIEAAALFRDRLKDVSAERIRDELVKTITSERPEAVRELYEFGVTAIILPEFDRCVGITQNNPFHCYDVSEHILATLQAIRRDPVLRMTMLLHDLGKPDVRWTDSFGKDHFQGHCEVGAKMADGILKRLKYDNDTRKRIVNLIRWHDVRPDPSKPEVRRTMYIVGPENFPDLLEVQEADTLGKSVFAQKRENVRLEAVKETCSEILKEGDCLTLKGLAINGNDLIEIGIQSRDIGSVLESALMIVLADPELNDRDVLLQYAAQFHSLGKQGKGSAAGPRRTEK